MWNNLHMLRPRSYLGDVPGMGTRPDPAVLARTVQQAQAASTSVSEHFDRTTGEVDTPEAGPEQAIRDLMSLSNSGALQEGEVATVRDILTRLEGGQPLRAKDVQALAGVVQSLQARIAPAPDPQVARNERADQIVELASGYTSGGDEQEILRLLGEVQDPAEMQALLATLKGKGWDFQDLLGEMDSDENRAQFLRLTTGTMSTEQQAEALQALAAGYTSGSQEQAMMAILRSAGGRPEDMRVLMGALQDRGMSYYDLFSELGDDEQELLRLTIPGMNAEQKAAAIQQFASGYTPTNEETAISSLLASETGHEGRAALLRALQGQGVDHACLCDELEDTGARRQFETTYMRLADYQKLQEKGIPLTDEGIHQAMLAAIAGMSNGTAQTDAQLAIVALERDGKLDARLMTQILALSDPAWTPLAAGVDREQLIADTLQDLQNPPRINQAEWGTCAATRVQTALALRDPARYVEILRRLASPEGDASDMVPGLRRPANLDLSQPDRLPERADGNAVVGTGTRSLTTRIMSPAMMNYGSGGHYVDRTDRHDFPWYDLFHWDHGGLGADQGERVLEGVMGVSYRQTSDFQELDAAAASGQLIPVNLKWGQDGGHALLYAGSQLDPASGQQVALLINPWGQRHTMPLQEFQARLKEAHIPEDDQGPGTAIPRPDRWNDLASYTPLQDAQFMNRQQVLEHSPGYEALDADTKSALTDLVGDYKLSRDFVQTRLRPLIAGGQASLELVTRFAAFADRHEGEPDLEARLGDQINIMQDLESKPEFQALAPEVRKRVLDLMASKDMPLDFALNQRIAGLAAAGKLTPELLTELEGKATAAEVRAAIRAA